MPPIIKKRPDELPIPLNPTVQSSDRFALSEDQSGVWKVVHKTGAAIKAMITGAIPVTRTELVNLRDTNTLTAGSWYNITDKKVYLYAHTTKHIDPQGVRILSCPKYYTPGVQDGNNWLGIWYPTMTPNLNDKVIYGGKVYNNITGAVGTASPSSQSLDPTNWELVVTTDTAVYTDILFDIVYDLDRGWVAKQWDTKGNVFGVSWDTKTAMGLTYNPADHSDWNDARVYGNTGIGVLNNLRLGIFNNTNCFIVENTGITYEIRNNSNVRIENNSSEGNIYNNVGAQDVINSKIATNTNTGTINDNLVTLIENNSNRNIAYNKNVGVITGNSNRDITKNTNVGSISNNAITFDIVENSNKGDVSSNLAGCQNITLNSNSGFINENSCYEIINNSNLGSIFANAGGPINTNSNAGNILGNNVRLAGDLTIWGIRNNSNSGVINHNIGDGTTGMKLISDNNNAGNIGDPAVTAPTLGNTCGDIIGNGNRGVIQSNTNGNGIKNNTNIGDITGNVGGAVGIEGNANIGSILDNSCNINLNTNYGEIKNNTVSGNISANSNLGLIGYNTGNVTNITNNSNAGRIGKDDTLPVAIDNEGNDNTGDITSNSNTGIISSNLGASSIRNNSNKGRIVGNNVVGNISDNNNDGAIEGNTSGFITYNSNKGQILGNTGVGFIQNNSNIGVIQDNVIGSYITFNTNLGDINGNGSVGVPIPVISLNANNGSIIDNDNFGGQIVFNMNRGLISNNESTTGNIEKNTNAGDISNNIATTGTIIGNGNVGYISNNTMSIHDISYVHHQNTNGTGNIVGNIEFAAPMSTSSTNTLLNITV